MTYLQIVLNIPLNQTFTYSYIPQENEKAELKPEIGKRAEIRFGFLYDIFYYFKYSSYICAVSWNIGDGKSPNFFNGTAVL